MLEHRAERRKKDIGAGSKEVTEKKTRAPGLKWTRRQM
jgi:hypothetical protein